MPTVETFPLFDCFFYGIATVLVLSSLMVVLLRHPVRAVLCLVLSFVMAAMLWILLGSEFLALMLLFVYVGAVMTLFLFVVMMLPDSSHLRWETWRGLPFAILLFALLMVFCFDMLKQTVLPVAGAPSTADSAQLIGGVLYTHDALVLEMVGVLLLVAMISAVMLSFGGRKKDRRTQRIAKQLSAKKSDRLRLLDLH